jgi:hypothetical protein
MDERDREMRDRDWRRSERYDRGTEDRRHARGEDRSWGGTSDDEQGPWYGARRRGPDRDRVFGERETGMSYGGEDFPARYGRPEGVRRGARERGGDWRSGTWQDRDYGGESPAMEQDEYDAERQAERYGRGYGQGYAGRRMDREGGRFLGDDRRQPIYRQEYGQGGVEYGAVPPGYDADRDARRHDHRAGHFAENYGLFSSGAMTSGGTGGYDYERGYGDAGRGDEGRYGLPPGRPRDWGRDRERNDRGNWFDRAAAWFRGDGDRYGADYSRHRGFQGMGPKGYQRPDERINEEAHERLTDDSWVDASNISVSVSGGEVTLSGTVDSREAKHRAERIVEDISGVSHVQNNLRVDKGNVLTSPSSGYGDSVLQAQMREADAERPRDARSADAGKSR